MSDNISPEEYPLLEIEIMQLSNLFGVDSGGEGSPFLSMIECDQSKIDTLSELDIYRIPRDRQLEIFSIAAFRVFLGRDPSEGELESCREVLKSSKDGFRAIVADLTGRRDAYICQWNENRERSIKLTLGNIARWSGKKRLWWRK